MTDPNAPETGAAPATPSPGTESQPNATSGTPAAEQQRSSSTPTDQPAFAAPDAYKDKPWVSKVKSSEDLWKMADNLQQLAGKKHVVPDFATATPAEVEEFYGQLRPTDKTAFAEALKLPDTIPEKDRGLYTELLHETGARPEVAAKVIEKFTTALEAEKAQLFSEKGFTEEMKKSFGDESAARTGEVASNIKANLSAEDQELIENVPNKYLGIMYRYADAMMKSYGAKETSTAAAAGSGSPADDLEARKNAQRQVISDLSKRAHTAQEKETEMRKLSALYGEKG